VAVDVPQSVATVTDQAMYEQSVLDKENSLIHSFSNMIIDENAKNLQQFEVSNGKLLHVEADAVPVASPVALANGNGHIENVNNKKWVEMNSVNGTLIVYSLIAVT